MDASSIIFLFEDFFLDKQFLNLIIATIVLFLFALVAWYFYHKQLVKRDLFEIPKIKVESKFASFMDRIIYFLKYLLFFPIYSFIWFLVFSFMLFLLSKSRPIEEIFYFAIVVVAATRISAYVSASLAEDMGKLLPWTLVFIFLTDPNAISIEGLRNSISVFIESIPKVSKYLLFITFVEWVLRIGHWVIVPKKNSQ